ncbi:MAG: hypothetical protein ACPGTU_18635 [Myxococcota bacterium]
MQTLIDPATADLIFTLVSCSGLMVMATMTLAALPWSDEEIEATEAAASNLLEIPASVIGIRATR